MLQVTEKDNGLYTMKIKSPKGGSDQGDIMLEVMTEYKEEKWFEWMSRVKNDRYEPLFWYNLQTSSRKTFCPSTLLVAYAAPI